MGEGTTKCLQQRIDLKKQLLVTWYLSKVLYHKTNCLNQLQTSKKVSDKTLSPETKVLEGLTIFRLKSWLRLMETKNQGFLPRKKNNQCIDRERVKTF